MKKKIKAFSIRFIKTMANFLSRECTEKIIRNFSVNHSDMWERLISRKKMSLVTAVIEGVLLSYIDRFVLKPKQSGRRYVICRFRGVGDSLSFYHTIWLLEKKGEKPFDFISIPLYPHEQIIRFLFGEDRMKDSLTPVVAKWLALKACDTTWAYSRWDYKFLDYCLERTREMLLPDEQVNLECLEREIDFEALSRDLEKRNPEFQRIYHSLEHDAIAYQAYQGHIKYIRLCDEMYPVQISYAGYNPKHAEKLQEQLNITRPYICLQIRQNPASQDRISNIVNPGQYRLAVQKIISRGYQIVLMGNDSPEVEELVDDSINSHVIPYGKSKLQSFENDLHLVSGCAFFWGCCSGPSCYAHLFNKPVLLVNYVSIGLSMSLFNHRYYPKKHMRVNGEELTWREILDRPYVFISSHLEFKKKGIYVKEIEGEEMCEAVDDFLDAVENPSFEWRNPSLMQSQFRSLFDRGHLFAYYSKGLPSDIWFKRNANVAKTDRAPAHAER